jgi:hypothetical protein
VAKLHLDRLKYRFPYAFAPGDMSGPNYRDLMSEIVANGHQNTQRAIARVHDDHFRKQAAKIKRSTTQQLMVPDISEVLPKRSVFIRKGAEQGNILSDSLRDELTKNLRSAVKEYLQTGGETMQYRRGVQRGRINPELVDKLRGRLTDTFSGYTKPDATGIPPNIDAIANTEIRSAVSDIKHEYAKKLESSNPDRLYVMKTWRHFPRMSKRPRKSHAAMNGTSIPMSAMFHLPAEYAATGRKITDAVTMAHPHDPSAPVEHVVSCHCECDYQVNFLV